MKPNPSLILHLPIASLTGELEAVLKDNILSFWQKEMPDYSHGGFYGRIDGLNQLHAEADKAIILNTRILWAFSAAYRQIKNPAYLNMADRAYSYILSHFLDQEEGGVYWMLDFLGRPVDLKKQIYAQAFAIYAFSEYYLASGRTESLNKAIELFELIEKHSFDHIENGYLEAFDHTWKLLEDLRLSDKDANEKKTMNTHLHILEAYTNLYRCVKIPKLKEQLHNLVIIFKDRIIRSDDHFGLFFDEHWNLKSEEISFGHNIEGSWLLLEAAQVLADKSLENEVSKICLRMVDKTLEMGMDSDGGIMNEAHGNHLTDTDKHWWPQAEAMVGLANAWQVSRKEEYLQKTFLVWKFIQDKLIDHESGEWHWRVNRAGQVNREEDKAGPWKCPYHNGRAMLELIRRLKTST